MLKNVSHKENRTIYKPGTKIGNYVVVMLIGQGGYGDIYSVEKSGSDDGKLYALKFDSSEKQKTSLEVEVVIMNEIHDSYYFPKIIDSDKMESQKYIVMELFGASVSNTRRNCPRHCFSIGTVLRLGFYMLKCIEDFHKHGFVHRDIKPGNFLLRDDPRCILALIDFGLSRRYINRETGKPFPERKRCGFRGTLKYASPFTLENRDQCPRDDLFSWCYSLVELAEGKLPWAHSSNVEEITMAKKSISPKNLLKSFPPELQLIYRYIIALDYESVPNYDYIFQLIIQAIHEIKLDPKTPFEWESFNESHIKSFSPIPNLPHARYLELPPLFEVISTDGVERNSSFCVCNLI